MLAGTASASVVAMGIATLLTGTLASRLGPEKFGAYMLARRAAGVILPFTTLAMGVAIPRYVAMARQESERRAYLLGGLLLGVLPGLVVLLASLMLPDLAARLLFGGTQYQGLLIGTLCLLIGSSCYSVLYGFYRGLGRMGRANAWQLFVFGIGPAAVVYSPVLHAGVERILLLMGLVGCAALSPLLIPIMGSIRTGAARSRLRGALRELYSYGIPRAPAGLALQWLLALGPFLASRHGGMADAGFLLAGQAVFQIADVATSAFGVVILPKVAVLHAEGRREFLGERVSDVIAFVCHIGLFASLHLLIWSRPLILTWLGPGYTRAVPLMQVMLLAVIPYIAYVMLRAIIDGVENRPVNTVNLCFGMLATGVGSYLSVTYGWGSAGLAAAATLGLWLLAALSVLFLWKRYGLTPQHLMLGRCLGVNALLWLPAVAAGSLLQRHMGGIALLAAGAAVEGLLLVCYCLVVWRLRARWATELVSRVLPAGAAAA